MNADKFAYWLQGALELNPDMLKSGMTPEQVQTIQDHLDLVFTKVTPDRMKEQSSDTPDIPGIDKSAFEVPNIIAPGVNCSNNKDVESDESMLNVKLCDEDDSVSVQEMLDILPSTTSNTGGTDAGGNSVFCSSSIEWKESGLLENPLSGEKHINHAALLDC
jgi:hypothetical protein